MTQKSQSPYWVPASEALQKIEQSDSPSRTILILGGGIAGLVAAYELGKLKHHKVYLVEASKRIGGRIWTHRFGENPGEVEVDSRPYHELGAMRVPEKTHDYTWNYIHEMDLKTREFFNNVQTGRGYFDIKGEVFQGVEANEKFVNLFPGMNDLEKEWVREGGPVPLLSKHLTPLKRELEEKGLVSKLVKGQMDHSYLRWMDSQSVRTFLMGLVEQEKMTLDALELIGASLSLESLWSWSLAQFIRGDYTNTPSGKGKLYEIIGGMDLLPRAIYQKIITEMGDVVEILQEVEATGIHIDPSGSVHVDLYDRKNEQSVTGLAYDQVLCTLPFPVLRTMKLSGISLPKVRAIRNIEYTSSTKVLLLCKKRFWEEEGIFGGRSVSDRLSRQTYYPSDFSWNSENTPEPAQVEELTGRSTEEFWSVHLQSSGQPSQSRSGAKESQTKGVLLGSYSWTDNARQLGKLSRSADSPSSQELQSKEQSERAQLVVESIQQFHPDLEAYVEDSVSIFWDTYPWSKGAFSITPPGDLIAYYQDGRRAEGRLFFAGEHISIAPGWIQGALESSLAAVGEMLYQALE